MSGYYLSPKTIKQGISYLLHNKFNQGNELFTYLILKHAGFNVDTYIDLSKDVTKIKMLQAAKKLSYLYISNDQLINKHNFMNPLSMKPNWAGNTPTEALKGWATNRLKNNIIGGSTRWRKIIDVKETDDKQQLIKENYGSFNEFFKNEHDNRVNLKYFVLWVYRFTELPNDHIPISLLINSFKDYFHLTDSKTNYLFSTNGNISIHTSNELIDSNQIREWIGNPKNTNWIENTKAVDADVYNNSKKRQALVSDNNIYKEYNRQSNITDYLNVLNDAKQVIFMGPPGTSKSYMAHKIAKKYRSKGGHVKQIQFHPQTTYQWFVKGQILKNNSIYDTKGIFIKFLEQAIKNYKNSKKDDKPANEYLLIIDEINRANVGQVFGELIQLLDRNYELTLSFNEEIDGKPKRYSKRYRLPNNFRIIGTMNTTDRTVGRLDYALQRRFYQIYFDVNYNTLMDNVFMQNNEFSIEDLLKKINDNLINKFHNKNIVIGHAIFFKKFVEHNGKFVWPLTKFTDLFNYVIVPLINDYCNYDIKLVRDIIGPNLPKCLRGEDFLNAINKFL